MATNQLSPYGKALYKQVSRHVMAALPEQVEFWGLDNPDSILNRVPEKFSKLALSIPVEMLSLGEDELLNAAQGTSRPDTRFRILLWEKYDQACAQNKEMNLEEIAKLAGLPSLSAYLTTLQLKPALLAWILRPSAEYQLQMKEGHSLGMGRLMEILKLPLTRKDPKTGADIVNIGVGMLILQAFRLMDQRLHGGYTQKSVNVNVDASTPESNAKLSMEAVEARIKELTEEFTQKTIEVQSGPGPSSEDPA